MNDRRVDRVLARLQEQGVSQMILTDPSSIFYLTGKMITPGSRLLALYISGEGKHRLFVNRLFPMDEDLGVEVCWFSDTDDICRMMVDCTDHGLAGRGPENDRGAPAGPPGAGRGQFLRQWIRLREPGPRPEGRGGAAENDRGLRDQRPGHGAV